MAQKTIDFPAKDDEAQMDKITQTIMDLADCLETDVKVEKVSMIRITFDGTQVELESLLRRLTHNSPKTKSWSRKAKNPVPSPIYEAQKAAEDKLDPMGS